MTSEVEIEHRVVLHRACRSARRRGRLRRRLPQRDEVPRAFRHFHRLARAQQPHELHDLYVEFGRTAGDGFDRRLHALDVAAVIGAPDVDHVGEAAIDFGFMIGDVGGEIGVTAVGFFQRPVDVVAEIGRAKQRLLAVFPILDIAAFWRRQTAFVDVTFGPQPFDGGAHSVVAAVDQRTLGKEHA